VKRSEVVYIQGRSSSDNVAMSYTLDGPGSFPGSILVLSVFSYYLVLFSCMCFSRICAFQVLCVFHVFSVSCIL
jgi:hypothetical protein